MHANYTIGSQKSSTNKSSPHFIYRTINGPNISSVSLWLSSPHSFLLIGSSGICVCSATPPPPPVVEKWSVNPPNYHSLAMIITLSPLFITIFYTILYHLYLHHSPPYSAKRHSIFLAHTLHMFGVIVMQAIHLYT